MIWGKIVLWLQSAWSWCKRHWQLLLGAAGTVAAFIFLGRKHVPPIVAPALVGADEAKEKIQEATAVQLAEASAQRDAHVADVLAAHTEAVNNLTNEQHAQVAELRADPVKLNTFLQNVGKSVRK